MELLTPPPPKDIPTSFMDDPRPLKKVGALHALVSQSVHVQERFCLGKKTKNKKNLKVFIGSPK